MRTEMVFDIKYIWKIFSCWRTVHLLGLAMLGNTVQRISQAITCAFSFGALLCAHRLWFHLFDAFSVRQSLLSSLVLSSVHLHLSIYLCVCLYPILYLLPFSCPFAIGFVFTGPQCICFVHKHTDDVFVCDVHNACKWKWKCICMQFMDIKWKHKHAKIHST